MSADFRSRRFVITGSTGMAKSPVRDGSLFLLRRRALYISRCGAWTWYQNDIESFCQAIAKCGAAVRKHGVGQLFETMLHEWGDRESERTEED